MIRQPVLFHLFRVYEDAEFCVNVFVPEIAEATKDIVLAAEDREKYGKALVGTVAKLLYAFLWQASSSFKVSMAPQPTQLKIVLNNFFSLQEQFFPDAEVLFSPLGNRVGAALLPVLNTLINDLFLPEEDFPHHNPDLQLGVGVYPGEGWCNPAPLPHAKWHLQTGIALVDFAHLADLLHVYLTPDADDGDDGGDDDGVAAITSRHLVVATAVVASVAVSRLSDAV